MDKQDYLVDTQRIAINCSTNLFSPPSGTLTVREDNSELDSGIGSGRAWQLHQRLWRSYFHFQGSNMV